MIYIPKFGEDVYKEKEENLRYINDKIEIQLLDLDITEWSVYIRNYFEKFSNLKEMTVHLPIEYVKLEVIYMSDILRRKFESFLTWLIDFTKNNNYYINVLSHFSLNKKEIEVSSFKDWVHYLLRRSDLGNINFVFENSLAILGYMNGKLLEEVLDMFSNKRFSFCFDICHYNILKYYLGSDFYFPKKIFERCSQVHFSYTLDNGYGCKHGIVHPDIESCEKDLLLLKELGIDLDKVIIVAEINEADYVERPDLIKELDFLKSLSEKY